MHWADIMSTLGDIMMHVEGHHEYMGDVQYIGVFNRNSKAFITLLPHMHHGISPMY